MRSWSVLGACVAVGLATLGGGCVGMEGVKEARDRAGALAEGLDADAQRWDQVAAGLDPADPNRAEAEAMAASARAGSAAIGAGLRRVDTAIDEANNPGGMAGKALEVVLPFVPAPARVPLMLGAGLAASLARGWQLKRGLSSVVKGLDTALREDGAFAERFKSHANTFRATQTALARRVVDGVAGRSVTARMGS